MQIEQFIAVCADGCGVVTDDLRSCRAVKQRTAPSDISFRQRGAALQGFLTLVLIALGGVVAMLYLFGTIVPPGFMGVRQIKFGIGQGFSQTALKPGLHWAVPFYSTVHLVPKTMQLLHFHQGGAADDDPSTFETLEIQSADRATVDVDVSVLYRFLTAPAGGNKPHGGPADLFKIGTTDASWVNEVRRRTEDQLKRNLGLLRTAKFYDPTEREERLKQAQERLNEALAPSGVQVDSLMLRRFSYREDRIDNAIFQKNLQEQEERRNEAQARFTEVEGFVNKLVAERDAQINTINVQAESDVRVIRSEGDLFESEKRASGDLAVAKAQAEVDKLKADALAQASGAKVYVGRELAPLLSTLRGGVVSDIDPYDLDAWSKKLGTEGHKNAAP
ncbi:MAG: hypothetical protein EBZ48_05310 [Proteobacteria bacterium]|nr:hypothetical protein [Pseudomonadota bacterium]